MFANLDTSILNKYFKFDDNTNAIQQFLQPKKDRTEADRILQKYPDRAPIIASKNCNSLNTPEIDKHKFLVPLDLTIGQFLFVIRKRLKLHPATGLFLFIDGTIACNHELIGLVYERSFDREDGFLHVVYSCENVFG